MRYEKGKDFLKIFGTQDFDIKQTLDCGQIFSYSENDGEFVVLSADKMAKITQNDDILTIKTHNPDYFENFFDLKTDYSAVKKALSKHKILVEPISFGHGIRILKQDLFETLISFIVSANNNIKRIKMILNRLREKLGTDMGGYHAFPTRRQMLQADEKFFVDIGAGYRAKYLFNVLRQIEDDTLFKWQRLDTKHLREKLISLCGVGPKVADCILLFGYSRGDVFPVDTWIKQMYNKFYENEENREKIRKNLTEIFGEYSGYAQQYLFFFMRR